MQVNVEEGDDEEDLLNPDRSLMRFEFLETILRFACEKYKGLSSLAEQLDSFVENELTKLSQKKEFDALYNFCGDEYRSAYIYSDEVVSVLRKHFKNLDLMHRVFSRQQVHTLAATYRIYDIV